MNDATKYYAVIGNRDHIKIKGDRRPFWEFLNVQPDGFLSSLAYLPIPHELPNKPMIGDCGAWSYKSEVIPTLKKNKVTPQWTIEQYKKHFKQNDLVIAPDHMLIPIDGINLDDRRQFNIQSAKEFLPLAIDAGFKPMATVHGMDLNERLINIGRLYQIGYRHFAFGGLAARASQKKSLLEMIEQMSSHVRSYLPDAWIHVLGLSSPSYYQSLNSIGINSCDGSSHFKQAFTAGTFFYESNGNLFKFKAVRKGESLPDDAPECNCLACKSLKAEGIDTRSYGSNENNMGRAAHNLNMLMRAQKSSIKRTVALVSCVSVKSPVSCVASDFYRSDWFKKTKAYIEQEKIDWQILSAKHGLVDPLSVLSPYDQTLNTMNAEDCKKWAESVFYAIQQKYPTPTDFVFFAGEKYRKYLIPLLQSKDYTVQVPLQGLGIGQQLSWLAANIKNTQLSLF